MMKKQYAKRLLPSSLLTVDGTLYPYRGKIGFKQCNPSNTAKNMYCFMAVHVWFMCFCVILLFATLTYNWPYAWKPEKNSDDATKYYAVGTHGYMKYLVTMVWKYILILESNIFVDQYFNPATLAKWVIDKCSDNFYGRSNIINSHCFFWEWWVKI